MPRVGSTRRYRPLHAALVGAGILCLAVCAPAGPPAGDSTGQAGAAARPPTPAEPLPGGAAAVRTGVFGAAAEAGIYVALERGYFLEQGLTLELVNISSGVETVQNLATGQLTIATGGMS